MENKFIDFESWLEEKFINMRVSGSTPITKDNCEDLFDNWLSEMEVSDVIEWANLYGQQMYLDGNSYALNNLKK